MLTNENNKYFEVEETKVVDDKFRSDNVIKRYNEDNKLDFPLILLSSDSMELFRIKTLKSMLEEESLLSTDLYNVYVFFQGSMLKIGKLSNDKLRVVLTTPVFKTFRKQVMLDENTLIEGDLLHALCGFKEIE